MFYKHSLLPVFLYELFLKARDVVLEVLVPFEFALDVFDVSLELNLAVVLLFELLTELVQLHTEVAPLFLEIFYFGLKLR